MAEPELVVIENNTRRDLSWDDNWSGRDNYDDSDDESRRRALSGSTDSRRVLDDESGDDWSEGWDEDSDYDRRRLAGGTRELSWRHRRHHRGRSWHRRLDSSQANKAG